MELDFTFFIKNYMILMYSFIYLFSVYLCSGMVVKDNMREPTLSFYLVSPYEDQTCIFRLGSRPLSLLNHDADPDFS